MESRITSLYILALLVISCIVLFCNAQEVENEREFDYGVKSEKGPKNWGTMKKEWGACNNGTLQSPIDILSRGVALDHYSSTAPITLSGTPIGTLPQSTLSTAEVLMVVNNRYDMELHLVHLKTDPNLTNRIAVVGILYKIGTPDQFLSKLMANISSIVDNKDEESALGMVDPNDIQFGSKRFYRYLGSLTVPPCTGGVIWTLNKKVKTVSRDQVRLMREAVHDLIP
ncbi:hypothetical protein SASPL_102223 [Salvia splendens]|uniref:Alpha-carbonic anhydrase domain-containing protein n=1 Tax=Salvia splendens TaxID=180675 RepID=A0A8X9AE65_SALSN|nr:hypothetical protein SASPL_102223 [Salvia splendens]